VWYYKVGNADIPNNWQVIDFDFYTWEQAAGGFGYGDNDDNTILFGLHSIYISIPFEIQDLEDINEAVLHADYDDGFVAYLNGVEIARNNLGEVGQEVAFDEFAFEPHEANLHQGQQPEAFKISADYFHSGQNLLSIQIHNINTTSSDFSSNFFLSLGISSEERNYRQTPDWFNAPFSFSNLPIIKITTENNNQIPDDLKISAHMGVIDIGLNQINRLDDSFNNYDGKIGIELQGTSSLTYDKKSYSIETRNEDGTNNNVELLGLPRENDWILYGPYADKSLLRNWISYHLGRLTGHYAPRTQFCEIFIDESYVGLYLLTEKIKVDNDRVDITNIEIEDNLGDQLTGGYIIKIDRNPANEPNIGWDSSFPDNRFFAYVDPKASQITQAQKDYIHNHMYDFESAMYNFNYDKVYQDFIDLSSWVDYFLVTEIGKHIDAYKLSFYMYKDKDSKGGKLHMGPLWDFNFGYGNFDFDCPPDPSGWAYEFPDCGSYHPFWARKINEIPNVQHLTKCRWEDLRETSFHTDSIMQYIDFQIAYLGSAIDRNFTRWPVLGQYIWANNFIGSTFEEESNYLKQWLNQRLSWMDDNLPGSCGDFVSKGQETMQPLIKVYPNPVHENIQIEFPVSPAYSYKIEIRSLDGIIHYSDAMNDVHKSISTQYMVNGVYVLILKNNRKIVARQRIVILHD